jgi:hypothetical protein
VINIFCLKVEELEILWSYADEELEIQWTCADEELEIPWSYADEEYGAKSELQVPYTVHPLSDYKSRSFD